MQKNRFFGIVPAEIPVIGFVPFQFVIVPLLRNDQHVNKEQMGSKSEPEFDDCLTITDHCKPSINREYRCHFIKIHMFDFQLKRHSRRIVMLCWTSKFIIGHQ